MSNKIEDIISDNALEHLDRAKCIISDILKSIKELNELGIDVSGYVLNKENSEPPSFPENIISKGEG